MLWRPSKEHTDSERLRDHRQKDKLSPLKITKGWNPATFGNMTNCAVFFYPHHIPWFFHINPHVLLISHYHPLYLRCQSSQEPFSRHALPRPADSNHHFLEQSTRSSVRNSTNQNGDIWECNIINHDYARWPNQITRSWCPKHAKTLYEAKHFGRTTVSKPLQTMISGLHHFCN
jgi:hypothetical protein